MRRQRSRLVGLGGPSRCPLRGRVVVVVAAVFVDDAPVEVAVGAVGDGDGAEDGRLDAGDVGAVEVVPVVGDVGGGLAERGQVPGAVVADVRLVLGEVV